MALPASMRGHACEHIELSGNLTISDSLLSVEAALDGIAPAYTFEQLALPHIKAKKLKRVLSEFSPTFPGFYLYYPSRRQQPSKLKTFRGSTHWRIPAALSLFWRGLDTDSAVLEDTD